MADLAAKGKYKEVNEILAPFLKSNVDKRRNTRKVLHIESEFSRQELVFIQRILQNMPREVFQVASRRASVVIPLCNVSGVSSILFEKRSALVRTHKNEVCFPGGMVDDTVDASIVQTRYRHSNFHGIFSNFISLREMEEEIGIPPERAEVLGILRCNWAEVATMTGVAVTPVVAFIGDLNNLVLSPNPAEVSSLSIYLISI